MKFFLDIATRKHFTSKFYCKMNIIIKITFPLNVLNKASSNFNNAGRLKFYSHKHENNARV